MKKVTVKVPESRHGPARLRRQGAKRLRMVDTDEEILAGLGGGTGSKVPLPFSGDYFTEKPETVDLTPWIVKMLRRGSLEEVTPASPPKAGGKKPTGDGNKPIAL